MKFLLSAAIAVPLALIAAEANANLVTYNFSGQTTSYGGYDPSNAYTPVPIGTAVSGSFTYDTDSAPFNSGSDYNYFPLSSFSIQVGNLGDFPIFSFVSNVDYDLYTQFAFSNSAGFGEIYGRTYQGSYPYSLAYLYTQTYDSTESFTSLQQLPGAVPFLNQGFFENDSGSSTYAYGAFQVTSITPLSAVPEPTTALFGAAIIGMASVSRRRR